MRWRRSIRKAPSPNRFRSTPITNSTMRPRSTARTGNWRCGASSKTRSLGSWTGTPLRDFLKLIGADTRAKYCWFQCADKEGYNSPLDMQSALHPQTQMTIKFGNEILPRAYGYPMKIRVPTKLGFKNPKYEISMEVTNDYKGGYWEDQGYNSFSGS